jgi:hypothetical protein
MITGLLAALGTTLRTRLTALGNTIEQRFEWVTDTVFGWLVGMLGVEWRPKPSATRDNLPLHWGTERVHADAPGDGTMTDVANGSLGTQSDPRDERPPRAQLHS